MSLEALEIHWLHRQVTFAAVTISRISYSGQRNQQGTLLTNSSLDLKGPGHSEPEDLKKFRKLQVLVSQEIFFFFLGSI